MPKKKLLKNVNLGWLGKFLKRCTLTINCSCSWQFWSWQLWIMNCEFWILKWIVVAGTLWIVIWQLWIDNCAGDNWQLTIVNWLFWIDNCLVDELENCEVAMFLSAADKLSTLCPLSTVSDNLHKYCSLFHSTKKHFHIFSLSYTLTHFRTIFTNIAAIFTWPNPLSYFHTFT